MDLRNRRSAGYFPLSFKNLQL